MFCKPKHISALPTSNSVHTRLWTTLCMYMCAPYSVYVCGHTCIMYHVRIMHTYAYCPLCLDCSGQLLVGYTYCYIHSCGVVGPWPNFLTGSADESFQVVRCCNSMQTKDLPCMCSIPRVRFQLQARYDQFQGFLIKPFKSNVESFKLTA